MVSCLFDHYFIKFDSVTITTGKYAPQEVMILPLDLTSGEDILKEAVEKAESFFDHAGVDCMIHNAAYERPVS